MARRASAGIARASRCAGTRTGSRTRPTRSTMLPGISDLRGNADKAGLPSSCSRPGPRSRAHRCPASCSIGPRGIPHPTRSSRRSRIPTAPSTSIARTRSGTSRSRTFRPGSFTVVGWIDANNNHDRDPHELQDSATITLKDTARVELLAFIHDSIGPHVVTVEVRDSLTLHATFDKPVDPGAAVRQRAHHAARGRFVAGIRSKAIVSAREIDKQRTDSLARADSIRARHDTAFRRQYQAQHRVPTDSNAAAALRRSALLAT